MYLKFIQIFLFTFAKNVKGFEEKNATFGGGCFWCIEACFLKVDGVTKCVNGYAGGTNEDPTYENTAYGDNNNAECIQVTYDPNRVSYKKLLEAFFLMHDPTTTNRQGYDIGPQYRSIILYHDNEQKSEAENYINQLNEEKFDNKIVTLLQEYQKFWPGEVWNQNYYAKNLWLKYSRYEIKPRIEKFINEFEQDHGINYIS